MLVLSEAPASILCQDALGSALGLGQSLEPFKLLPVVAWLLWNCSKCMGTFLRWLDCQMQHIKCSQAMGLCSSSIVHCHNIEQVLRLLCWGDS